MQSECFARQTVAQLSKGHLHGPMQSECFARQAVGNRGRMTFHTCSFGNRRKEKERNIRTYVIKIRTYVRTYVRTCVRKTKMNGMSLVSVGSAAPASARSAPLRSDPRWRGRCKASVATHTSVEAPFRRLQLRPLSFGPRLGHWCVALRLLCNVLPDEGPNASGLS